MPPARAMPAAARPAPHESTWRKASTGGDTSRPMERRLVSGPSPYEPVVGYSRAVVAGPHVFVAGTAPIPPEGDPPEEAYEQARLCLAIVGGALGRGGAGVVLRDGEQAREDDVEAIAEVTLGDDARARRDLLAAHATGQRHEPLARHRREEADARQLGDRGGDVAGHGPLR